MATLAKNKKARFDYEILDTYEAGLVLHGYEVKGIRAGKAKLEGSYVVIRGDEAFLIGASIAPYQPINTPESYEPDRPRKLLLTQKELAELHRSSEQQGLTIVPLSLYPKGSKIKLEIAVARGKKKTDKRETIKRRDTERELKRSLKF